MCVFIFVFFSFFLSVCLSLLLVMTMKPAWKHSHIAHFEWTTEQNIINNQSTVRRVALNVLWSNEKSGDKVSVQPKPSIRTVQSRITANQSHSIKLFSSFNRNFQMGTKSPGTSQRCRLILQHCLAIQLSKPGHTPEDFWMYDSGYMIFQVKLKSSRIAFDSYWHFSSEFGVMCNLKLKFIFQI